MTLTTLLLATVCGTASGWGADSLDCRIEDQSKPQSIVRAKFYRAYCGGTGMPVLVDSLPAAAGVETCFQADTTVCVSYFMTAVNGAGMESLCKAGISYPRVVGIPKPPAAPLHFPKRYYDLQGRRVYGPLKSGVYFEKQDGVMKIVVIR